MCCGAAIFMRWVAAAGILAAFAAALYAGEGEQPKAASFPRRVAAQYLPNLVQLHPQVFSGGLPEGEQAFKELADLGVATVISVDAAAPDVQQAEQFNLQYVHLPHGYDGVPEERKWELAKAMQTLPRPIYIHCHHGRHRSPAAAAVACVAAGLLPSENALEVLQLAGTANKYRGLYASVRGTKRLPASSLDAFQSEFRSRVAVPPMAQAMVEIEHVFAQLKRLRDADWTAPADHPDLDSGHQALLLRESLQELERTEEFQRRSSEFKGLMQQSRRSAERLEDLLNSNSISTSADWKVSASEQLKQIEQQCIQCHRDHRDNIQVPK
jgi:hypothetical protein